MCVDEGVWGGCMCVEVMGAKCVLANRQSASQLPTTHDISACQTPHASTADRSINAHTITELRRAAMSPQGAPIVLPTAPHRTALQYHSPHCSTTAPGWNTSMTLDMMGLKSPRYCSSVHPVSTGTLTE